MHSQNRAKQKNDELDMNRFINREPKKGVRVVKEYILCLPQK